MSRAQALAVVIACLASVGCSTSDAGPSPQPQIDAAGPGATDGSVDATTNDGSDAQATPDGALVDASDAQDAMDTSDAGGDASDAGPKACPYPPGPYGVQVGSVIDPALAWQGYAANATLPSTIQVKDFFDCDGTKGINALVLNTAAEWCAPSVAQAKDIATDMNGAWGADGVQVVELVAQDTQSNGATVTNALQWQKTYKLTKVTVVADPAYTFAESADAGFPANILVDPRTMTVVSATEGYTGTDPAVDALAQKNGSGGPKDAGAE